MNAQTNCSPREMVQESTKDFIPVSHVVRSRSGENIAINGMTRGKAIKLFCTECLGWESNPADCTALLCPLFPYRGKTMASQGNFKEEIA
jgi:hypothetical protein